jgi:hypothetical protein
MDLPNIGPYASVVGEAQSPRRLVYRRGYGVIEANLLAQNKWATELQKYNRLQPLTNPFGNHMPQTADGVFQTESQTNIAWDNTQPAQQASYQNQTKMQTEYVGLTGAAIVKPGTMSAGN